MKETTVFDKMYQAWESQTANYFDKVLRNPGFLEMSGQLFNSALRTKIFMDQFMSATWKTLLLPNKRDQERTLHLLNELHSRINDIEDRLDDDAQARDHKPGNGELKDLQNQVQQLTLAIHQLAAKPKSATKSNKKQKTA